MITYSNGDKNLYNITWKLFFNFFTDVCILFFFFNYPLLIISLCLETMISFNREKILKRNEGKPSLDSVKSLQASEKLLFFFAVVGSFTFPILCLAQFV